MPELSEVVTSKSVSALYDAFTQGVAFLEKREVQQPYFHQEEMAVAEPLVRYVYKMLMMTSVRDKTAPHPQYPYRATEYVADLLKVNGATFDIRHLARQVFSLLVSNGIGWKKSTGKSPLYLRIWPDDESLKWVGQGFRTTEDARTEARIEEEKNKPIKVYRNLRTIALPATIDAESIKEWVGRFVPAALDVEAQRDKLQAEVEELRALLDAATTPPEDWDGVGDALTAAFEDKKP